MKQKLLQQYKDHPFAKHFTYLIIGVLLYIFYGIYCWSKTQSTDNAYLGADLANVSSEISGVVKEVLILNNQIVTQGDIIALIDDHDFQANYAKALAGLNAEEQNIKVIEQTIIIEELNYKKLQESLQLASTTFDLTTVDYKRTLRLAKDNYFSQKTLDDALIALERAKAGFNQAQLNLQTSEQTIARLKLQKLAGLANLESLMQVKKLAERALNNTKIRAPITGKLANSSLQVGNYIQPSVILFSIVPENIYIDANFKETQIYKFKPGMKVMLEFDALPSQKIEGTIRNISPATGSVFSLIPPDIATGNFTKIVQRVPVRIDFKRPASTNFNLVPGMSVMVKIRTDQ